MPNKFRVISPVDGSIYLERIEATPGHIARTVDAARSAQTDWAQTSIADRISVIEQAMEHLGSRRAEIAASITHSMGRPIAFSGGEVDGMLSRARYMTSIAEEALSDLVPEPTAGFTRLIRREPLGVVLVLSPWNYPYLTAVNAVIPALLAGNTVVLKHSDQTPLAAEDFAEAFSAAGMPEGVFQFLHMNHAATAQVLGDDCIDHVCFTGSVAGGVAVTRAIAARSGRNRFIGAGLELGGKDAAYVRPDADLQFSAENIVEGAIFNSGQSCCGIERIYVHREVASDFIDALIESANSWTLGDPRVETTTLGPLVRQRNADAVRAHITQALDSGARPLIDTASWTKDRADSPYLSPQFLTNVNHSMDIMSEETFGPCAGIMTVDSDEEAIGLMNDSPFGLTASIWSNDLDRVTQLSGSINVGTVFMNRCDFLDPALAWTGVKNSGRGATLSSVGFENLTRPKSLHLRTELQK